MENGTFEFDIPQETLRRLEEFYQQVKSKGKEDIEENSEEEGTTRPPKPNIEVCSQCIVDNDGNRYSLQKKLGTSCHDIKHEHSAGVCSIDKQKIHLLSLSKVLR